jgi:hypothetical protein
MKEFERRTLVEALELAQRPDAHGQAATILMRIGYKLLSLLQEGLPAGADPECPSCLRAGSGMGPSHRGSERCESGSLASGGDKSHCTCDTCF